MILFKMCKHKASWAVKQLCYYFLRKPSKTIYSPTAGHLHVVGRESEHAQAAEAIGLAGRGPLGMCEFGMDSVFKNETV